MENINFIKIFFAQLTICMVLISGLVNSVEKYLPIFVSRTFRYGKFACENTSKTFIKPIEVPKSWFKHFYILSSAEAFVAIFLVTDTYIFRNPVPGWTTHIFNTIGGAQRYSKVTATATYLGILLISVQCFRRLYDTHFVSIFGKNGRINLIHYLLGLFHYFGLTLAILAEAPNFTIHNAQNAYIQWCDLSLKDIFCTMLFLWAWWQQYKATKMLANLRKNINGKKVSDGHHMPEGDLFEYVSSPHMLSEILMYASLTLILWENSTWWYVFFWVLSNQIESALLNHWWYKKTFPNYPITRKAVIPYIL